MSDREAMSDLETTFGNVRVLFGLEAQGHIPTVEKMRDDGKSWHDIARVIGWDADTAEVFYGRWCERKYLALRQLLAAVEADNHRLRLGDMSVVDYERLVEWMKNPNRKPPSMAFTAGAARTAAAAFIEAVDALKSAMENRE